MLDLREADVKRGFYHQQYYIGADVATVKQAKGDIDGIVEMAKERGGCLIRYTGNEEALKRYFGDHSILVRQRERDDGDEVLYMKAVGTLCLK